MGDQLASHRAARREGKAVNNVIQPALKQTKHVLARYAAHVAGHIVILAELGLEDAIRAAALLLLTKLQAVFALFPLPCLAMLARRGVALHNRALGGVATVALQEKLLAFPAALPANGIRISCHCRLPP